MSQPRIEEAESFLEITANAHQHDWHINDEEPQFGKSEIVNDTAPSWLELHPNGRFHVKIPIASRKSHIRQHSVNQPAREILGQMYKIDLSRLPRFSQDLARHH
jgi:hypothetical protein